MTGIRAVILKKMVELFVKHDQLKDQHSMKKIKLVLFTLSITATLQAQQPLTGSQTEVQQTVIKVFDALSSRDSVSLKNYCTADIALYEYGQVWNIDTL